MPDQVFSVEAFIGLEFSHYRTNEEIGSGEMGVFFRAHDQHLDREVAIKVLSSGTLTDETTRKHFHKETLALPAWHCHGTRPRHAAGRLPGNGMHPRNDTQPEVE